MPTLIFDIETVGQDFQSFDELTQHKILDTVPEDEAEELGEKAAGLKRMEKATEKLGLSPFTGKIVTLACLELETNRGAVYFQSPDQEVDEQDEHGFKYKSLTEEGILSKFWEIADRCHTFVTYNGRGFDVPFVMIRSAVHHVRPTKNLSKARYLYQMDARAIHVDLYDQLTFYRSFFGNHMSLHMACQAFGIRSPKAGGMDGSQVGEAFKQGKHKEIAEYCLADVIATAELYKAWNTHLRF